MPIATAMVFAGPLYRLINVFENARGIVNYISTAANLDAIGMGSLMAILLGFPSH